MAVQAIEELAQRGQTVLGLALQWLYQRSEVTSVILGYSSLSQLEQNLDLLENAPAVPLPEEALLQIWKDLTSNRVPYNHT